jgi:hypothetical protein
MSPTAMIYVAPASVPSLGKVLSLQTILSSATNEADSVGFARSAVAVALDR